MAEAKGKKDSSVSKPKARSKPAVSKTVKVSDEVRSGATDQSDDILFNNPSDASNAKALKEVSTVQTADASDDDLVFTPKKKLLQKRRALKKLKKLKPLSTIRMLRQAALLLKPQRLKKYQNIQPALKMLLNWLSL